MEWKDPNRLLCAGSGLPYVLSCIFPHAKPPILFKKVSLKIKRGLQENTHCDGPVQLANSFSLISFLYVCVFCFFVCFFFCVCVFLCVFYATTIYKITKNLQADSEASTDMDMLIRIFFLDNPFKLGAI